MTNMLTRLKQFRSLVRRFSILPLICLWYEKEIMYENITLDMMQNECEHHARHDVECMTHHSTGDVKESKNDN